MASEKQYTARQVAEAVLKKASELLEKSELVKGEKYHDRGIHREIGDPHDASLMGTSLAGKKVRQAKYAPSEGVKDLYEGQARDIHRDKLKSLKEMPKPDLPKSEEMTKCANCGTMHKNENYQTLCNEIEELNKAEKGKVQSDYSGGQKRASGAGQPHYQDQTSEKGIHTPVSGTTQFPHGKGTSHAGSLATSKYAGKPMEGLVGDAKKEHKKVLGEMKAMPKPDLPKSEDLEKCGTFSVVHEKAKREGYSEESADKIAGKAKAMEKSACPNCGVMHKNDNYQKLCSEIHELGKKEKFKDQNDGKENAIPNEHASKDADQHAEGPAPKGEIHPKEKEEAPADSVEKTPDPQKNPNEQKEGNNELAGTTPTQVGQDGKNLPGFDEMKGHLKLAKFIGYMHAKRQARAAAAKPEMEKAETGHEKGVHTATGSDIRSDARLREGGSGGSHAGFHAVVNKEPKLAKPEHEKVLGEMKAMPKPKLPG